MTEIAHVLDAKREEFLAFVFDQIEVAIQRNKAVPASRRPPISFADDEFEDDDFHPLT